MKTLIKIMIGTFALVLSTSLFADDSSLTFNKSLQVSTATSTPFLPSLFESPVFDVLNKTATSTGMLLESNKTIQYEPRDDKEVDWIIVKFKSDAGIRMRNNVLRHVDNPDKPRLSDDKKMAVETNLLNLKKSLQLHKRPIERYLKEIPESEVDWMQQEGERRSKTKLQNLNDYYRIPYEKGTRYKTAKSLLTSLANNPLVETSYTGASIDIVPIGYYPTGESFRSELSEGGVNAQGVTGVNSVNAAWELYPYSALGQHIKVAVLDGLFDKSHEDFPDNLIGFEALENNPNYTPAYIQELKDSYDYYTAKPDSFHGNASAGIIASPINGYPATGLVPEAAVVLQQYSRCTSIPIAAARMGYEGVIGFIGITSYRLGADTHDYYGNDVPIDYPELCFNAIQTVSALGVIVVIGSGNDSTDLDDPYFENRFNPDIYDSGAIVAGASAVWGRVPVDYAWGSRIDAHAPGSELETILYSSGIGNKDKYTDGWGGNSGSTAVVTGAVASIQSIAKGEYGISLTAREMRSIIKIEGVPQVTPVVKPIGSLPDILKAAQVGIPRIMAERAANRVRAAGTVPPDYLLLLDD